MFSRKKPKKVDLGPVENYLAEKPKLDLSSLPEGGPALPVLSKPNLDVRPFDLEEQWKRLGPDAWRVLERRRVESILPCDKICEFERYREVLHRLSSGYREEIFIGLEPGSFRPILVPRFVFERHGYILGGSGSGKTTHALAQVLIQLAEEYTDTKGVARKPPPILIIDMKQNGDRYLRSLAGKLARQRGKELRFYSNDPEYVSMVFDPLYCLRTIKYPIKLLETLLKAFSMIYPEGYGSDFFTNEQRVAFMEILYREEPKTMDDLIDFIRSETRGKSAKNPDARGLYAALAALEHTMHVHTDGSPIDPEKRIDFDRFFEQGEVMYVHLDSRSLGLLSKDIGKLLLFSLLETASQRERHGGKVQCFVAIDEFHRLAARNVVEMLEDARGAGIGFIIAHQSSSSLKTRDADLYGSLFENCSFKQCLTLEDPRVIELFRLIAGRTREIREGGSSSESVGTGITHSEGSSQSSSFGHGGEVSSLFFDNLVEAPRWGEAFTKSGSDGWTKSNSKSESKSWQEEMVSALTPEVVTEVNHRPLLSLVHVKGTAGRSYSDTGGVPILVQGLFPFLETDYEKMANEHWPLKDVLHEEYYHTGRAKVGKDKIKKVELDAARPTRPVDESASTAQSAESELETHSDANEGERRSLKARIRRAANRLAGQMLIEPTTVLGFAREHQLRVGDVLSMASALGIAVKNRDDALRPNDISKLKARMAGRKDGP